MQTCYERYMWPWRGEGGGGGGEDADINSDGIVLALRIPIPNRSPGAIAFALSHDCWKWTAGRREWRKREASKASDRTSRNKESVGRGGITTAREDIILRRRK